MTITLEHIEAEHSRIGALIEQLKNQPKPTEYHIDAVMIPLAAGERFAGLSLNDDGTLSHYVILLPDDVEEITWEDAKVWAAERGGELPTRREQSLLFTNLKDEFESAWYWSGEVSEDDSGWAWYQTFDSGYQDNYLQHSRLRARAVRRFIPSVI